MVQDLASQAFPQGSVCVCPHIEYTILIINLLHAIRTSFLNFALQLHFPRIKCHKRYLQGLQPNYHGCHLACHCATSEHAKLLCKALGNWSIQVRTVYCDQLSKVSGFQLESSCGCLGLKVWPAASKTSAPSLSYNLSQFQAPTGYITYQLLHEQ